MSTIKVNLSPLQEQKLRNHKTIRITPSMLGSGSELIIDAQQYHNLSKSIAKNKGMLLSLNDEQIKTNMSGGSLLSGLKKGYKRLPEETKASLRRVVKQTAKDGVDLAVDSAVAVGLTNPYTAVPVMAGKMAYDNTNAKRHIHKRINKFVDKSGMGMNARGLYAGMKASGLYAGMNAGGLYAGTGAPSGEPCLHCGGHGNQKELFLLEQANAGVDITRPVRKKDKKIHM